MELSIACTHCMCAHICVLSLSHTHYRKEAHAAWLQDYTYVNNESHHFVRL